MTPQAVGSALRSCSTGPDRFIVFGVIALVLAIHLASSGTLDFFRDELYFVACGRIPQWGYVDQPALVPLAAHLAYVVAHGNVLLFRTIPAALHVATVAVAMALVAACGGGRYARLSCGLAVALSPAFVAFGWLFTTNVFEPLAWTIAILAVVRARDDARWLLVGGATLGLSLETKYGLLIDLPGLVIGLACSSRRALFRLPTAWLAVALGAAIAVPGVIWQAMHGYPMVELLHADAAGGKNVTISAGGYLLGQVTMVGPFGAVLLLAGLFWPFIDPRAASLRFVPIAWSITFLLLVLTHGKDYYFAAAHVPPLAFGAVAIERWLRGTIPRSIAVAACASTLVFLPLAVPIGGVGTYRLVARAIHLEVSSGESVAQSTVPQTFADTFGWRELARAVDGAWDRLTPGEREHAAVWVTNYGEASAIELLTRRNDVHVISTHNEYWLRGPEPWDGSVALLLRRRGDFDAHACGSLREIGHVAVPELAMPYERNRYLYECRNFRKSIADVWRREKTYF